MALCLKILIFKTLLVMFILIISACIVTVGQVRKGRWLVGSRGAMDGAWPVADLPPPPPLPKYTLTL